ncbi:MAG TPA: type II secretion system F family protein [Vicinamibacterales bacterium]|nr:type II secretion system F family protein [Vicinamibacterales bacterium]
MEFRCRLSTPGGEITEGVYAADSEAQLRHQLEQKGLCVLSLRPRHGFAGWSPQLRGRRRIPTREFLVFNQELATLLKAGMPLVQSLDILRHRLQNPLFRGVLDDVHERVRGGAALSEAFAEHGALFPTVYTASLMAGEKSGSLEQVLRRYVAYVKVVSGVRRRTISALLYPAILLALALVVVMAIVLRVVPEFSAFYATFNSELPLITRVIVGISEFLRQEVLLLLVAAAATVTGVSLWAGRPGQRERLDGVLLRMPVLGPTARKFATSQLARTLATLLGGGIPLVNAIEIAARSIGNRAMAAAMEIVGQRVREGESFAAALGARGVFPDVAVKMAEVGEATGALQEMLNSLADFYDEEIETDLGRFVTLVEPLLLVIMGIVIAGLLLALYMPLFQLSSVVS